MPNGVETFIARWQGREGGQERANYALFLMELCDVLGLAHAQPASVAHEENDYVFERAVKEPGRDGSVSNRRIDLYKKDCFVLEAKQSRQKGGKKEVHGQPDLFISETTPRGRKGAGREWDVLMLNARRQAEDYVRLLPGVHEPPPFVIVCDVGHCFEIYANFRRDGKAFDQYPDRQSFRVYLDELRRPDVRERLVSIWTDPMSLDPARRSARVTRQIAERLAAVSKSLEAQKHPPQEVAFFLMRCLFTMFAEDVTLLPEKSFKDVLKRCEQDPGLFSSLNFENARGFPRTRMSESISDNPNRRLSDDAVAAGNISRCRGSSPCRRQALRSGDGAAVFGYRHDRGSQFLSANA